MSLHSRAFRHKWLQGDYKSFLTNYPYFLPRLVVTTNTSWRRRGGRSTWGRWRRRRTWSPRSTDSTRWWLITHHLLMSHCTEGAGGGEAGPGQVAPAAVSGSDRLHRPGAHAAHIPARYRTLVLLRNYLHRYQIIRKVLKSFQITFKVTLAKYNFDQRRESSFWHFVHK